jgi:hypothetical protein
MHFPLAAALIVLLGHGTALACGNAVETPARTGTAPLLIAQAHLSDPMLRTASDAPALVIGPLAADAPAMVRTSGRAEPVALFNPREERAAPRSPTAAAPAAPAAEADRGNGATLLLVGLALMAGIAMRRQGSSRP